MASNICQQKGVQLLVGIVGIYTCYWLAGYFQEKILKRPYYLYPDSFESDQFDSPITVVWAQSFVAWMLGFIVNKIIFRSSTYMPTTNLIVCAIIVIISTHTYILAIYITNFPIVMMVKSCNLISVVFVGVFCSKVRDSHLKLGTKKIIVTMFITCGILLYNFGGDQKTQQKATDIMGIVLLIASLLADGFLPDYQAVIKSEYQPKPMEMFEQINKWVTILCWAYALATGQLQSAYTFSQKYPEFVKDIALVSVLTSVGQIFVYRLIKQFKQHIVPFVITTRKIFTVVISIIFYGHSTSYLQVLAIILVFSSASFQYISEIAESKHEDKQNWKKDAIRVLENEDKTQPSSIQQMSKFSSDKL